MTTKIPLLGLSILFLLQSLPCLGDVPALPANLCTSFIWATSKPHLAKAAILLETLAGNRKLRLQLDTGSDVSGLFRPWPGDFHTGGTQLLKMGNIDLGETELAYFSTVEAGQADGILGLDSLRGKRFIIDYPAQKFCEAPEELVKGGADQWLFIPARLRSGKLFLFSSHGASREWAYFFDSGASPYHLLVDKNRWREMTGRQGDERDNSIIAGSGWGKPLTTVGAPLQLPFRLGTFAVKAARVHFIREQPGRFAHYPFAVKGLVGNAPFLDEVVLLDLRPGSVAFGIRRPPDIINGDRF